MNTAPTPPEDEIPEEIDFSAGARGKFHRPGATLRLPVYLDAEVQSRLTRLANEKGIELSALVNDLLRQEIERGRADK